MMKKGKRKLLTLLLCGTLAAGTSMGAFLLFGGATPDSQLVSIGLQHLADGAYLAVSSADAERIALSAEGLDTALGGGAVSAITVTELPPVTEGELKLGQTAVTLGQRIARENLSQLSFYPANGVQKSSFCFVPATLSGDAGYSLRCHLSLTQSINCCPVGKRAVTAVSTYASLPLSGVLSATDPEGDALCYEVVTYPQNGTVSLNAADGSFSYTPNEGFCGEDSFTWRAQDANGGFSEAETVRITVREMTAAQLFTDVEDANTQAAALRVAEAELMGGEAMGGKHYFHPKRALTRAAFVAILLEAAEVKYPEADSTGFADDDLIPQGLKGAIKYAKEQNWLGNGMSFRPNDPITRSEAAQIAAAVLGLSAPDYRETVTDFDQIPVYAADALYALYEGGYIATSADGRINPLGELTRADAAKFFALILNGRES